MSKILEDLAQEAENKILQAIENGVAPWLKPWSNNGLLPHNPYTGTIYQGINALRLMCDSYSDNRYLTFNQVKELGGCIKKGEKANYVLFVGKNLIDEERKNNAKGMVFEDSEGNLWEKVFKKIPIFNFSQTQGIDINKLQTHQAKKNLSFEPKERDRFQENPLIEKILQNSNIPIIHHQKDTAYYSPKLDTIYLPPKENFINKEQYYSTALHELGHATGHRNRLNRDLQGEFGTPNYAKEELRAELYSFLQALELGIDYNLKSHASYVDSWLKILKNDKNEISKALKDSTNMLKFVKQHWYPQEQKQELEIKINRNKNYQKQEREHSIERSV